MRNVGNVFRRGICTICPNISFDAIYINHRRRTFEILWVVLLSSPFSSCTHLRPPLLVANNQLIIETGPAVPPTAACDTSIVRLINVTPNRKMLGTVVDRYRQPFSLIIYNISPSDRRSRAFWGDSIRCGRIESARGARKWQSARDSLRKCAEPAAFGSRVAAAAAVHLATR